MSKEEREIARDPLSRGNTEPAWNQGETLKRFHGYMLFGKPYQKQDIDWFGTVRVNKNVNLQITDERETPPRQVTVSLMAMKPYRIDRTILGQLVLKATQEGPVGMNIEWDATGEPNSRKSPTPEDPLQIEILDEGVNPGSISAWEKPLEKKSKQESKLGIPSLAGA